MNIDIWNDVANRIQKPNEACQFISKAMENCKDKTFNGLVTAHFTNSPSQIRDVVSTFCSECNKLFPLKVIYLEMNGFDINPNRWYFDLFGYRKSPPNDDSLDWLTHWQSPRFPNVTLTGLESIQKLYALYMKENSKSKVDKDLKYNRELATLLVMTKFCELIDDTLDATQLGIDVYATAHDFDIVYHQNP